MPADTRVGPLLRAAVVVSSLEQSTAFYRNVLGLEETYFEGDIRNPAVGRLLGLREATGARCVILKAGGPAVGMIGLFEIRGEQLPRRDSSASISRGDTCLVFNHPDIDSLVRRVDGSGGDVVCPPTRVAITPDRESREVTIRDPDGVLINCIERDP